MLSRRLEFEDEDDDDLGYDDGDGDGIVDDDREGNDSKQIIRVIQSLVCRRVATVQY